MVLCLSRIAATACLASLLPTALAIQTPETKPLHILVDGRDGLPIGGTGPGDARTTPEDLRFWVGHGLSLGHIRIDDRARQFDEEDEQPYQNEIARVIFDEGTTTSGAHRLYVLTAAQRNATPPRPGTIYLLDATFPDSVSELHSYDLVDTLTASPAPLWEYDISDIAQLPGTNWIVGVGIATLGSTKELLVLLFERQVIQGQEELVVIAESRRPWLELSNACPGDPSGPARFMRSLTSAVVHDYGTYFGLFAIGNVDPVGRGIRGVASIKLDPAATLPSSRVVWPTDPRNIFDPYAWAFCDLGITVASLQADWTRISVSAGVVVDPSVAPTSPSPHLYLAAGRFLQVIEVDVSEVFDFVSGTSGPLVGFDYAQAVSLEPEPVSANESNLHWIAYTDEGGADLLFATGDNAIYCFKRMAPSQSGRTWQKFNQPPVTGHLMRENIGAGDRYHLWTVCYDTPSPWTVFDVTDRSLNPGVFPPERLETRYLPAGTDGAVAIPEWNSIYATNFAGLVRYDWFYDFENGVHFAQPDYDSYQPAIHSEIEYVTEQVELADLGNQNRFVLTPTGSGKFLSFPIDPITKQPGEPSLLAPYWTPWTHAAQAGSTYAHRTTFGWSQTLGRHFVLLDHTRAVSASPTQDELRLGRYRMEANPTVMAGEYFEELDLRSMDTADELRAHVYEVSLSSDARWAFVGCGNGWVVVELHDANGDPSFEVVDTRYTVGTIQRPDPFGNQRFYAKVEGIAQTGNHLFVSVIGGAGDPSPGLLAWFAFDPATGQVGERLGTFEGGVGPLLDVPFWEGGPVRVFDVTANLARVYAASSSSGAVLEFELDKAATPSPTFTLLSHVPGGTHFSQVGDVRPYDVGHPSGLPVVLMSRYRQTIAVLAADGMIPEPEEP